MKTHEAKNWAELAMLLTAQLRLLHISTNQTDDRRVMFLLELMQLSGEADPALVLAYLVGADSATGDEVMRYWTALQERGAIPEPTAVELAEGYGLLVEGAIAWEG